MSAALAAREAAPRFATLKQWLDWQRRLHPRDIDLGLERVQTVMRRMGLAQPPFTVLTVGGTNGKGSAVAYLEAMLLAAGYRVGAYTSPHLLRYNERVRIAGRMASDAALCESFARIDAARGDISLTLFEFGTLAALQLFTAADIDVAVLEVGLGGRLDATNALDADAALVTTVAIDHTDWLGSQREQIGYEKAGIYRGRKPAVCADPDPPQSLLRHIQALGAAPVLVGRDYHYARSGQSWRWWNPQRAFQSLPLPRLNGDHQLANAAAALALLASVSDRLALSEDAVCTGIARAHLAGRCQTVPGAVAWILDVAHNPQGAQALARCLQTQPVGGRTRAVFGILRDKDFNGVVRALAGAVDDWYAATLKGARGLRGEQIVAALGAAGIEAAAGFASVASACRAARREAVSGDRIVVFGSFHTVTAALKSGVLVDKR